VKPDRSESDRCLAFYMADDIVGCMGELSVPYWNGFMNEALTCIADQTPIVRQYAAGCIGKGSQHSAFAQVAPAAAAQVHKVLKKHGERHRRRRAVKTDAKQNALAVDTCIRTLGQICEAHSQQLGTDAGEAWNIWLANLPLKYNAEAGLATHTQLVKLIGQNHPALVSAEKLHRVLGVFADIYKVKHFSSTELDEEIAKGIANLNQGSATTGEGPLKELCGSLTERQKKKIEQILKNQQKSS